VSEYNTQSVRGRMLANIDEWLQAGRPGDWCFAETVSGIPLLHVWIPDGTEQGAPHGLHLNATDSGGPFWQWDGNREAPTLEPSILRHPHRDRPGWHGHMRQGELVAKG